MKLLILVTLALVVEGNIQQDTANEQCSREHGLCDETRYFTFRHLALRSTGCRQFCHCAHASAEIESLVTYYWVVQTCPPGTLFDDSLPDPVCNHELFVECKPIQSYYGTNFITGFMDNAASNYVPTLLIACPDPETIIKVSIPALKKENEQHMCIDGKLKLTYTKALSSTISETVFKLGVSVTAESPIMLFAGSFAMYSSDGSLILPEKSLGTEYIISSYPSQQNEQFLIVAAVDDTSVNISLNSKNVTATLNRLETYFYSGVNLSGTKIFSSAPVFIRSGNLCANIPNSVSACDHIDETMPPIQSLGQVHVASFMYPRSNFTISIAAAYSQTSVTIYDDAGNKVDDIESLTMSGAVFRTYNGNQTLSVISNKPILLTQYSHGGNGLEPGDPSMMVIPDVQHFGYRYDFVVPEYFNSTLAIVISSLYSSTDILLNGDAFTPIRSESIVVPGHDDYTILYGTVSQGYNVLAHTSNRPFGAWIYGVREYEEYAWSLGYN